MERQPEVISLILCCVKKQSFFRVLFHFLMPAEKGKKGEAMKLFSHEKHSMTGKKVLGT